MTSSPLHGASADPRRGFANMAAAMALFATQDALARHLAEQASVLTILTIRYWAFVLFVLAIGARSPGGLARTVRTRHPFVQVGRGVLLAAQVAMIIEGFTRLGLVATHALFAGAPLLVVALSGPTLGERVTLRRWLAILAGLGGALLILRPGAEAVSADALLVLAAAVMFAGYALMTRRVAAHDRPETSLFYTGVAGAAALSLVVPFAWDPPPPADWGWMLLLCLISALGHSLYIRALAAAEASRLQPLAYLHLVFASVYGVALFGESLSVTTVTGAAVVIAAGIVAMRPERGRG
ncbi:DMT family transporter [Elioraea rosea]|uniref:DMT family transporter n=1 Tax=Elioraea rosea TaxID=2492390 RepID=UPI00194E132B|nr:DMT family transporter [Elioraea rosea]